ncbi:PREDICTED: F-box/LRR-repeat protein 14-like [Fragaria vesca subsp. vesca]
MFLPENGLYGLSSGGGLPKLSKVSVRGRWCVATDRWIHRFPNLTYLDLGECGQVDDDYAVEIDDDACSKTLNTLVLAYCKGITDSGVSHLQNMQCLEELVLESCGYGRLVTDSGVISAISGHSLYSDSVVSESDVDDYALEAIGLVGNLIYLNLELCGGVSDNGLGFLAQGRCTKTLNTLVLADCKGITDLGLSHLQNFRFLEELNLKGCYVTDTGVISAISPDRSFKKLNLANKYLSDQSMAFVAENCPNLEILDLSSSQVTGAGVRAFYGHRCLQSLVLRWCPEFCWSDIEHMVLGCKSLKSIVLSMPPMHSVPESVSRIVSLIDEG